MKNFIKAFIEAQKNMGVAVKDSSNPFFKSKYADLNSVREASIPALNAQGIAVLQPIIQKEGKSYVRTILIHESGESVESDVEIIFGKINDAQAQGSGITYARRYGLQSLVNIGAEDDDGNKAAEKPDSVIKRLASAIDTDMKEVQEAEQQKQYAKIKRLIESATNLDELQKLWSDETKTINAMKKYASDLYGDLCGVKDEMKTKLTLS